MTTTISAYDNLPSHVDGDHIRNLAEQAREEALKNRPVFVTLSPGDSTAYPIVIVPSHAAVHLADERQWLFLNPGEAVVSVMMSTPSVAVWSRSYLPEDFASKLTDHVHTHAVLSAFFETFRGGR